MLYLFYTFSYVFENLILFKKVQTVKSTKLFDFSFNFLTFLLEEEAF